MEDGLFTTATFTYEANNNYSEITAKVDEYAVALRDMSTAIKNRRESLKAKAEVHANVANAIATGTVRDIQVTINLTTGGMFIVGTKADGIYTPILEIFEIAFRNEVLAKMEELETTRAVVDDFAKAISLSVAELEDKMTT